jgi:hypothetical protein
MDTTGTPSDSRARMLKKVAAGAAKGECRVVSAASAHVCPVPHGPDRLPAADPFCAVGGAGALGAEGLNNDAALQNHVSGARVHVQGHSPGGADGGGGRFATI